VNTLRILAASFAVCACGPQPPPEPAQNAMETEVTVSPSEPECRERIETALAARLASTPPPAAPSEGWSVETLERAWDGDTNGYGYAAIALALPDPRAAIPLLARMTSHRNALTGVEAASVLAILGDRSGLDRLRDVPTLTNSGIEAFYARAALSLLGEPPPAARSVFTDLETLLDECTPR
jgi:hypothetical protein